MYATNIKSEDQHTQSLHIRSQRLTNTQSESIEHEFQWHRWKSNLTQRYHDKSLPKQDTVRGFDKQSSIDLSTNQKITQILSKIEDEKGKVEDLTSMKQS